MQHEHGAIGLGFYANKSGFALAKEALYSLGWEERSSCQGQRSEPMDLNVSFREITLPPGKSIADVIPSGKTVRFLGVDVGYSKRNKSLGYCVLELADNKISICPQDGELKGYGLNTLEEFKSTTLPKLLDSHRDNQFALIALDGPLTPEMHTFKEPWYRPQEKLLSKIRKPNRIKAQSYMSPVGQNLYQATMDLRYICEKWGYRYEPFSGIEAGKMGLLVESFPKLWLAVMFNPNEFDGIFDKDIVTRSDIDRIMAISIFKNEHPAHSTDLPRFLENADLSFSTKNGDFEAVFRNKDITAAFVSAMGGLLAYIGSGSVLGNDEFGSFLLPARNLAVNGWDYCHTTYAPLPQYSKQSSMVIEEEPDTMLAIEGCVCGYQNRKEARFCGGCGNQIIIKYQPAETECVDIPNDFNQFIDWLNKLDNKGDCIYRLMKTLYCKHITITLSTAQELVRWEFGWTYLTKHGGSEFWQAHITKSGGEPTRPKQRKRDTMNYISDLGQSRHARSKDDMRRFWQ